jgi:hypothetical protein
MSLKPAGQTQQELNRRVYDRLQSIKQRLERAGVPVKYRRYLLFTESAGIAGATGFGISIRRRNTNNSGVVPITVQVFFEGRTETFGYGQKDGDFQTGLLRIEQLFGRVQPDVLVRDAFTLILFCPLTERARVWIAENVQSDAQWFGNALVVEPRYGWPLMEGMGAEGLVLE